MQFIYMERMMKKLMLTVLACGLLFATTVQAHHSFSQFDRSNQVLVSGEVVRWAFNNPHAWLYVNVEDEVGGTTLWGFEASGPVSLLGRGITGSTFEPGDVLTFMYCPLRDGRPAGAMGWVQMNDGSILNPSDGGCAGDDRTIERWKGWIEQGFTTSVEAESSGQ